MVYHPGCSTKVLSFHTLSASLSQTAPSVRPVRSVCQRLTKSVSVLCSPLSVRFCSVQSCSAMSCAVLYFSGSGSVFCLLSVVCSHCIFAHCAYFTAATRRDAMRCDRRKKSQKQQRQQQEKAEIQSWGKQEKRKAERQKEK